MMFKAKSWKNLKSFGVKNALPNLARGMAQMPNSMPKIEARYQKRGEEVLFRKLLGKDKVNLREINIEDITFEHQQALMKVFLRYDSKAALNPQVPGFIKERMYNMHISNPQVYTFNKLATIFAIPRQRVRAIVLFKIEEHQRMREGLHLYGTQVEEKLEEKFGCVLNGRQEIAHKGYEWIAPYEMVDEDVNLFEFNRENLRRRKGPRREIPAEPPSKYEALKKSYLIEPREDRPMRFYKCYIVDISGRFSDYNRPILVSDFDRSLRTATWEERRAIIRRWRPKEIKLTKGSIPTDTFVNPDKIYDFDDPRVNRAYYYPDYSGPYPKMPIAEDEVN